MLKLIPTTLIACAAFAFSAHAATITLDFEAAIGGRSYPTGPVQIRPIPVSASRR